jgi:hypothetical protein
MSTDNRSSLVRQAGRSPAPPNGTGTVYEEVAELIRQAGWARGVGRDNHGRYSLREAVDAVVASTAIVAGDRISRSARCRNHLRELAGTTSIDAWNDAPDRRQDEIFDLLLAASRLHPQD